MTCKTCPFADNDDSEYVQSLGCLPSPYDILQMQTKGYNWGCHSTDKLCAGLVQFMNSEYGKEKYQFDKNNPIVKYQDYTNLGEEKAMQIAKNNLNE